MFTSRFYCAMQTLSKHATSTKTQFLKMPHSEIVQHAENLDSDGLLQKTSTINAEFLLIIKRSQDLQAIIK